MSPHPAPSRLEARCDTATDVLSVRFTDAAVASRREVRPGIVVAHDEAGRVAAMEIREASAGRLAAGQDLRRLAVA